ncbi:MAG: type III secretion system effector protein [Holosporales bacterium]|nr:type III secretion system effector protein [Holosporales bacterium]
MKCWDSAVVRPLTTRQKSLVGSIFHELTHALHHISNTHCDGKFGKNDNNDIWTNKEERYTISGFREDLKLDVICEYCFEACNSTMPLNPALGRDGQFRPRLGHSGYRQSQGTFVLNKLYKYINSRRNDIDAIVANIRPVAKTAGRVAFGGDIG